MKFSNYFSTKLLMYLIFWAVSFYLGLEFFSRADEVRAIDVIYTFLFHLPLLFVVSVHSFHLLPNYLAKSNFWAYGLTLLCLLGTAYPLYNFSYLILADWLFPGYYLVGVYEPLEVMGFSLLYLLVSSSLEFARSWFDSLKAKNRISELETEKRTSELKALRAQVNPHFLFNSLNTIYSEALRKSDKAPKLILQLSDMLRYVVDKMDEDRVPVKEEIDYLKNYFLLHSERLNDPSKASLKLDLKLTNQEIAPLLLINFIENSFKHADLTEENSFISIQLSLEKNTLTLNSVNTYYLSEDNSEDGTFGTGLKNAKRRLELSYPKRHTLNISKDQNLFTVKLKLELV